MESAMDKHYSDVLMTFNRNLFPFVHEALPTVVKLEIHRHLIKIVDLLFRRTPNFYVIISIHPSCSSLNGTWLPLPQMKSKQSHFLFHVVGPLISLTFRPSQPKPA